MKNKNTAALLALFTGFIGGHRFYLGQNGLGVVYLFACWTFIPMGLGILDALVIALTSEDRFNEKYNSVSNESIQEEIPIAPQAQISRNKNEITPLYHSLLSGTY